MKKILADLYNRLVKNWQSTFVGFCIFLGLAAWKHKDINTDELIAFLGAVGTIVALLHKTDEKP